MKANLILKIQWRQQNGTIFLEKHDYDFPEAIKNEVNTILTPGAEFRKILNIKKLWQFREDWEKIESILKKVVFTP